MALGYGKIMEYCDVVLETVPPSLQEDFQVKCYEFSMVLTGKVN